MSLFQTKTIKRNMHKRFTGRVDLKLISLVKAHPVLYDYNDPKYMDFNTREVAWQKIGDELEKPADCKIRWINIRDVHRRILRKNISGYGRPARAYKYDTQLEFMKNFYKEVVSANPDSDEDIDNGAEDNEIDDKSSQTWTDVVVDCNDLETDEEKPLKKAKKTKKTLGVNKFEEVDMSTVSTVNGVSLYERESDYDVSDPVDAFLLSIGATLKKFSPYHLNLAKSKIFHIVQEHDLQQIVEKQQGRMDSTISPSIEPAYYTS